VTGTVTVGVGCGLVGLLVGSFLNVVIHRVPRRESVVRPRSHCPACGVLIAERDNVPVLSWLLLRGRCRACHEPISVRYPLVEVATGALFVAAALRFGADWVLPAYLLFFAVLLAVSAIDLEHYIVPNRIVYPTLLAAVPLLAVAALLDGSWGSLATALLGALGAGTGLLVIHLVSPRGMGFGDVRLAVVLGLFLGWIDLAHVALGMFLGFLLGALGGVALIALRVKKRRDHVPFAPFLALGALVAVLAGNPILDWYIR
jgi:leader peptidase (prepilin peptidase)/N-methyltransferase